MNCFPRTVLILLSLNVLPVHAQKIINFTTSKTVYDYIGVGSIIWVATSGGLYIHDFSSGARTIRPANKEFPDPSIRALAIDSMSNMWIGSHEGYLMRRDQNWDEYINYSYVSAEWRINALAAYGSYLFVGSDKGVSLFDINKKTAVKNANQIGTLSSSSILTMAIYKNHLYVGGEAGSARLKVNLKDISGANFYDPGLWKVDSSVVPVHSFYEDSGKIIPATGPSGRIFGVLLTAETDTNYYKGRLIVHDEDPDTVWFDSPITTIKSTAYDKCVIGTEEHYFYYWEDVNGIQQVTIPGPTFASANRVHVDGNGLLWVLPYGFNGAPLPEKRSWKPGPPWLGINTYNGDYWTNHSPSDTTGTTGITDGIHFMGHMGSSTEANAILEDTDGNMWFGFSGGSIKYFNQERNEWWHYCTFGQGGDGDGAFVKRQGNCPAPDWGKCDAIAQDSAGYMWFGSWNNSDGCLVCYKPSKNENNDLEERYRRFPPYGVTGQGVTVTAISADPAGNILCGMNTGELRVVRYTNNPLTDSIFLVREIRNLQNVYRIVVLDNGTSLVLTADGVKLFDPTDMTLTAMEEFDKGISVLAVENDNLFWYAVPGKGVVRFDYLNNEKTVFGSAQGLIATQVNDLFIDRKNGSIWVATDRGVSRIALGYSSSSPGVEQSVVVFPNPYSFKRHTTINFRNVPGDAKMGIYSLGGQLVGRPETVIGNENTALYRWSPPLNIAPGTYFYSIVTPTEKKTGKLLLVP